MFFKEVVISMHLLEEFRPNEEMPPMVTAYNHHGRPRTWRIISPIHFQKNHLQKKVIEEDIRRGVSNHPKLPFFLYSLLSLLPTKGTIVNHEIRWCCIEFMNELGVCFLFPLWKKDSLLLFSLEPSWSVHLLISILLSLSPSLLSVSSHLKISGNLRISGSLLGPSITSSSHQGIFSSPLWCTIRS